MIKWTSINWAWETYYAVTFIIGRCLCVLTRTWFQSVCALISNWDSASLRRAVALVERFIVELFHTRYTILADIEPQEALVFRFDLCCAVDRWLERIFKAWKGSNRAIIVLFKLFNPDAGPKDVHNGVDPCVEVDEAVKEFQGVTDAVADVLRSAVLGSQEVSAQSVHGVKHRREEQC